MPAVSVSPSTLQSGVRFRAYPDAALATTLSRWIGCQRVVYTAKVDEDRYFAALRRGLLVAGASPGEAKAPLDRCYSQFKDDELTPWLSAVPSQVLRNGAERWFEAKQRQLKGLARAPRRRTRADFNSVLLSSELFRFKERVDRHGAVLQALELGTEARPVGVLSFKAHRPYGTPRQITVRRQGRQWFVSFSYEHAAPEGLVVREAHELAYELDLLDDEQLKAATLGLDRNVADNCIATSDGRFYALSAVQLSRIERKRHGAQRLQRRLSRQAKGSKNRARTRNRLAAKAAYAAEVRRDFSHQTSHALTTEPANAAAAPKVLVLEALKVRNMTARPKARQDERGRWLRNGAASKAGLNRSILSSCWGLVATQLKYKAARRDALVVEVSAAYSSQECSRCGHTHPDNRDAQRFVCQRCGFATHADTNASCNIAARGIELVRGGTLQVPKAKKRLNKPRRKAAVANETSGPEGSAVPVEGAQVERRSARTARAQRPRKQESLGANSDAPTKARSA